MVTNQGTISFDADGNGTNESSALTDDPATPTAGDATSFTVVTPVPFIDLNGDGLGDVVLYNVATGAGSSQVNDGSGGFTATAETWDAGWKVFPLNLNHDAYTDIFFYHPVNGFWVQALNTGSGTFTYTVGNWDPAWTVYPADLDGDAITDLFLYNAATGVWVKSFVDGTGGFANYTAGTWDPAWTFTPADLNGDGRDDFFLYNPSTGVWVKALSQAGVGTFDYPASGQWDLGWQISRGGCGWRPPDRSRALQRVGRARLGAEPGRRRFRLSGGRAVGRRVGRLRRVISTAMGGPICFSTMPRPGCGRKRIATARAISPTRRVNGMRAGRWA